MKSSKILPPSREELIDLRKTMTLEELSYKFFVGIATVNRWCMDYGIKFERKFNPTKEELQELLKNKKPSEIAKDNDVNVGMVYLRMKEYKLRKCDL